MTLYRFCFKQILSDFERISFKHKIASDTMTYIKIQVRSFDIYCMRYPTMAYHVAMATNWHRNPVLSLLFLPLFVRKGKLLLTSTSIHAIYNILADPTCVTQAERQKVTVVSFRRLDDDEGRNFNLLVRFLKLLPNLKIVSLNFLVEDRVLQAIAEHCPELTILDCRLRKFHESQQPHSPFDDYMGTCNRKDVLFFPPYDPKIQDRFVIRDFREQINRPDNMICRYVFPAYTQFHVDETHCHLYVKKIDMNFPLNCRLTVKHERPDQQPVYEETFDLSNSKRTTCHTNYNLHDTLQALVHLRNSREIIPVPVRITSSSLQSLWHLKNLHSTFFNDVRWHELQSVQDGFDKHGVCNLLSKVPSLEKMQCNQYIFIEALRCDQTRIYSKLRSISVPTRMSLSIAAKLCPNVSCLSVLKFENHPTNPKLGEKFKNLTRLRIEWIEGSVFCLGIGLHFGINLSSLELTKKSFKAVEIEVIGSVCANLKLLSLQDYCNNRQKFAQLISGSVPVARKGLLPFPKLRVLYYKLTDPLGLSLFLHKDSNLKSLFLDFRSLVNFCRLMDFIFDKFEATTFLPELEVLYITPILVCTHTLLNEMIRILPKLKYLHSQIADVWKVERYILRNKLSVELVNLFDEFRSETAHFDCAFF